MSRPRSDDDPPLGDLPRSGEDILREVERLQRKPARFQCLGMSFTLLAALALAVWLLTRLL